MSMFLYQGFQLGCCTDGFWGVSLSQDHNYIRPDSTVRHSTGYFFEGTMTRNHRNVGFFATEDLIKQAIDKYVEKKDEFINLEPK